MIEWLENELGAFKAGLLLVGHDRRVLDASTTPVLELNCESSYADDGGYAGSLEGLAARKERAAATKFTRRKPPCEELDWLHRGAKAHTRKSRVRIKRALKLIDSDQSANGRRSSLITLNLTREFHALVARLMI